MTNRIDQTDASGDVSVSQVEALLQAAGRRERRALAAEADSLQRHAEQVVAALPWQEFRLEPSPDTEPGWRRTGILLCATIVGGCVAFPGLADLGTLQEVLRGVLPEMGGRLPGADVPVVVSSVAGLLLLLFGLALIED